MVNHSVEETPNLEINDKENMYHHADTSPEIKLLCLYKSTFPHSPTLLLSSLHDHISNTEQNSGGNDLGRERVFLGVRRSLHPSKYVNKSVVPRKDVAHLKTVVLRKNKYMVGANCVSPFPLFSRVATIV